MSDENKLIETAYVEHMSDHFRRASEELLYAYQRNKEAARHHCSIQHTGLELDAPQLIAIPRAQRAGEPDRVRDAPHRCARQCPRLLSNVRVR